MLDLKGHKTCQIPYAFIIDEYFILFLTQIFTWILILRQRQRKEIAKCAILKILIDLIEICKLEVVRHAKQD